ncbi:NADH-ubiquinone oxidoreductase-F iron-sulfur binding region domain-containing protein [Aureivirga sp. CE67]|uniref:NADH-ubiquinone oxidoreductase-F iron-sulfur binding region domain-containing protein n=1 Tax=Aureivirga sp. CE67 TaxID=1788983 RepID=UPI0018CB99AD|nr:NADH-ubiquinone oxidoreductase-F iron-sulfur binding region domain-containing protein [Aureivirga sp. CE67]
MSKNLSELSGKKGITDNLFEKLGIASKELGTPSSERLEELAQEFLIGKANTYGATSFYDFMKPENKGKKAYVCNGSACVCARTQENVQEELEKYLQPEEIGHITCLGRCHENGAFQFQDKNYSAKSNEEIKEIFLGKNFEEDTYNVKATKEVLTVPYEGFEKHYEVIKNVLKQDSKEVLEEIKKSNVRGRGGAGFPMGIKWEACRNEESNEKFIICNADEGDPGAYSDRYLLEKKPHAVLAGMMIAGYCTHANWGALYIRAEYPESVTIIQNAIDELREHNLLGKNIDGSGFDFDFKIIEAKGAYICGEETALINSIEGQRPEVRTRPPYPTQQGLFNRPTIVNNVETLAAAYSILKNGGETYNNLGTEKSSGTKLVCLDSFFNNPGVYEVEMGTPLMTVINDLGGGLKKEIKALHIGGPLGGIVPKEKFENLAIDFESFAKEGFLLGHAGIVSIPESFPMIQYLEHLFDFAAYESCGKCFPCRLGTKRAHEMLQKTVQSDYKISRKLFNDLLNTLEQGSLCAHGGGIPLPAKNALQYFGDELEGFFN